MLATAGSPVPGSGNADYMVLPASGTAGGGNTLANSNFDPYIIGPANFFLTVAGVTSHTTLTGSIFSGIKVGFGTGPDKTFGTVFVLQSVPEPSSGRIVIGMAGLVGTIALARRRRAP